ncbi:MAG: hypothetical protein QOD06_1173 [Candidatus Binatota bacterium]|jgi:hypothetical protein|nr:hypothetical protein [Candidatus Binatota bacterium]
MKRNDRTSGKSKAKTAAKPKKQVRAAGNKSSPRTRGKSGAKTAGASKSKKRSPAAGAKSSPRTGEKSGAKTVVATKPKPARGRGPIQKRGGDLEPKKRKIQGERDAPVRAPRASSAEDDLLRFGRQRRW